MPLFDLIIIIMGLSDAIGDGETTDHKDEVRGANKRREWIEQRQPTPPNERKEKKECVLMQWGWT